MHTRNVIIASLLALGLGAGSATAVTRAMITLSPGDIALVPSRNIECGVISKPNVVTCFKRGNLPGAYAAYISNSVIEVVKSGPRGNVRHGSKLVFRANQPK